MAAPLVVGRLGMAVPVSGIQITILERCENCAIQDQNLLENKDTPAHIDEACSWLRLNRFWYSICEIQFLK